MNGAGAGPGGRPPELDDIEHLRRSIDMPEFPYVDFSARQRYRDALADWPLLDELARLRQQRANAQAAQVAP